MIKNQLDWGLLAVLAERNPQWSFVYVGPKEFEGDGQGAVRELATRPNVHFLGRKPVDALPGYAQHVDVCMMPYAINDYTRYIFPLKLNEYLAGGRPVIGSPIATLLDFENVVRIADGVGEWSTGIAELLGSAHNGLSDVAARQAVAQRHDWTRLVAQIGRAMCVHLGPDYVGTFDRAVGNALDASAAAIPLP